MKLRKYKERNFSLKEYLGIDIWKKIFRIRRDLMLDDAIPLWRKQHIEEFNHYKPACMAFVSPREGLEFFINGLRYDIWICPTCGSSNKITRSGSHWFYDCNKH